MPVPKQIPEFAYKIVPTAPPQPIPDQYPLSELDKQDGFVHLSTSWQVPVTCDLFFADAAEMWIIKLKLGNFLDSVKWDDLPNTTDGCPHLYGNFGAADAVDTKRFERPSGRAWSDVFESGSAWLE